MTEGARAFWKSYLETLSRDHPHRRTAPDSFSFGDTPSLGDELAELVRAGRKRATTSLPAEFASLGLPLPKAGDLSIVTSGDGTPIAIIELTRVEHVPFGAVNAQFAADEGEGDGSLAWWQQAHRRYFDRVANKLGVTFDDATPVICQRFRVVWPKAER